MRNSQPKPLNTIFINTNLLKEIQQRALVINQLRNAINVLLPSHLQSHCRVANYRKGVLILETSNAAYLAGLKFKRQALLTTLRADILPELVTIEIEINPQLMKESTQALPVRQSISTREISAASAQHILKLASICPEQLQRKLKRLAALAQSNRQTTNLK